ncbi:unnamed protein product [Microthlaspi erraticum]|uniref:Reverse transcriptase domain-containing protein n=1 Tax=Microthlaspi erraticum TaxID=1685480 RepID=A0A6D2KDY5_9BRAS|nr:unnamed protein product [Microthlaspi erraticum]
MLKVDLRKAFDTVCWDFLDKILEAQNFPPLFREWIRQCYSMAKFSILVNGEPAGFFAGKKGLRQGDPLSPYLFILVMEALSKLLDLAGRNGEFALHPQCENPLITHLLFADDLLVFSDGSQESMAGIKGVMSRFKSLSGLDMNAAKSEVFFSGYSEAEAEVLSGIMEVRIGTFPTRYLGLPLNSQRLSIAVLEPFLEKITKKLHSYTAKFLSFAGKIKLVSSVVYGMVNFWSQVYTLPKEFYSRVDSLCSAFLWKNGTQSAGGARVAWKDICKPKSEGGLGIRQLSEFEVVFRLKQAWNLFTKEDSLWIAWVWQHIFARRSYWITNDAARFSRSIRSLLQLKPLLSTFLKCEIKNGRMASFWFDNWTEHGPVIDFVGQAGPRLFRVSLDAKVKDAVLNGAWNLPSARSERSEELQITLTTIVPPDPERGDDVFLWRLPSDSYSTTFSSKGTWEQLRIQSQRVNWAPLVWFKEAVPRCSFILCYLPVMFRGTGNSRPPLLLVRLLQRGVALSGIKSRWPKFTPLPSGSYREHLLQPSNPGSRPKRVIMKLLLQQTAYAIWRERNARIFTPISTPAAALKNAVDRSIRDRLLSYPATDSNPSLLEIYFSCISYPL